MMRNMRRGIPNLFKEGVKHRTGLQEAVVRNLEACKSLSNITVTSLGPNGMNKMLINHLDRIFVTSDTATLLKELEVQHPAAKMLAMAAGMQESEIGDGSNFVIVFGGELLANAEELITMGLHPADIIAGYNAAYHKALELLQAPDLVVCNIAGANNFTRDNLIKAVTAPMATKQYGYESFLAPLVADACLSVLPKNPFNFTVESVRVVKLLGGNLQQSEVIKGMVLPQDSIGTVKRVVNAKVAVFTCALEAADTETKGTVLIHNASELMNYNESEEKQIEKVIRSIADSGVKVLVTGGTVDDIAAHFCEKFGLMVIKIQSKFELRRVCKATRARPLVTLGPVRPEEQGFASSVYVQEVGSGKITVFEQDDNDHSQVATILLRASTHNILNDIERAIDDGVNTVRQITRDGRFVAGAGAFEIQLAKRLGDVGAKMSGLEQYAFEKFARSLEVVPRALAENGGMVSMDILSQLYAAHEKGAIFTGVDIEAHSTGDMTKQNIIDLLILKQQAIKLSVDAVLTILRVDQIITAKPAGGPKMKGQGGGHWDDEE